MKLLLSAALATASMIVPLASHAEDERANVVRALLDPSSAVSEPLIEYLNNEKITIYKHDKDHYYVPRPVPDWVAFREDVSEKCAESDGNQVVSSVLDVMFYNEAVLTELAVAVDIGVDKIFTVPHFARSVFLEYPDGVELLDTSITAEALIQGGDLAANKTQAAFERFRVEDTCQSLIDFLVVPKLTVSFHALGTEYVRSSVYAEVVFKTNFETFFDISNDEKETETATISVSSNGSGLVIDAGLFALNDTRANQTITTSTKRFRVVNREWLSQRAATTISSLNVEEICEGQPADCGASSFRDTLLTYVFRESENKSAVLVDREAGAYSVVVDTTVQSVSTISVDENVKAFLNHVNERSSTEEAEFSYSGITAKVKKDSTGKLTIDGDVEWKKEGDDWVPTKFSVYLVDLASLESTVEGQYTQILRGDLSRVSFVSDQVSATFPKGFISTDVLSRYLELEAINQTIIPRITNLENTDVDLAANISAAMNRVNGIYLMSRAIQSLTPPCPLENTVARTSRNAGPELRLCPDNHQAISQTRFVPSGIGTCSAIQVCSSQ